LELTIDGVATSRDFHLRVMEDAEFRRGDIDIQWLERRLDSLTRVPPPPEGATIAAIAAMLLAERDRRAPAISTSASGPSGAAVDESGWLHAARRDGLRAG
ncbi:MAG TPA: acetyl-CoA carboxylase biotin carboxylase subunit, partial [Gemmatimonadaceae bacterium]|nr:acetyl-CoA carboxylase biotin carboxylase subunit [Gemmatimonadaceae bacterium]